MMVVRSADDNALNLLSTHDSLMVAETPISLRALLASSVIFFAIELGEFDVPLLPQAAIDIEARPRTTTATNFFIAPTSFLFG